MQVQVELADLLARLRVPGRVKLHVFMPHVGMFHLGVRETQQLLVDSQQSLRHHVQREILDQFVLVHGELALLHLIHVVGQVPGVDLPIERVALHRALPLLQGQDVLPLLDSNGLQRLMERVCKVGGEKSSKSLLTYNQREYLIINYVPSKPICRSVAAHRELSLLTERYTTLIMSLATVYSVMLHHT